LVELFCCVATLATMSLPIWFFGRSVLRNYQLGYTSGTLADVPAWIPESLVLLGMTLFWIQLLAYTLKVIRGEADLDARRAAQLGGVE
jgi:TRAP-type mannitol/chloroaromatic compound transport system permease small subunit